MPTHLSSSELHEKPRSRRGAVRATAALTAFLSATAVLTGTAVAATSTGAVSSTSSANLSALHQTAAAAAASSAAARNPAGTFGLTVSGNRVHFYGTATDPDATGPVGLAYLINGVPREGHLSYPAAGYRYDRTWSLPYGLWTIGVLVANTGPGTANTVLGTRTVNLVNPAARNPRGATAMALSGQTLIVQGTTFDLDALYFGLFLRIYDGGHLVAIIRADGRSHLYRTAIRLAPGRHLIKVVAQNVGTGTANPIIGARWVTVANPVPAWQSRYAGSQRIAASMLTSYGWGAEQMGPLVALWNKESGWNPAAYNPSGAYGIPQALPGGKMASAGADWRTNPATQIRWGLGYIKGVYGSPAAAWGHSQATNWY